MASPLWLPLEVSLLTGPRRNLSPLPHQSNPDVMSNFLYEMGLQREWGVVDVIGFDTELLHFLPQPVVALILL